MLPSIRLLYFNKFHHLGSAKKKHVPVVEVETEDIADEEEFEVAVPTDVKLETSAEMEHELKTEDFQENSEVFAPESATNEQNDDNNDDDDDDDFEWKEEPLGDVRDDSTQSEGKLNFELKMCLW